jgi:hypothetical protein
MAFDWTWLLLFDAAFLVVGAILIVAMVIRERRKPKPPATCADGMRQKAGVGDQHGAGQSEIEEHEHG